MDWFPRLRAMSLAADESEGEQIELRSLQTQLETTHRCLKPAVRATSPSEGGNRTALERALQVSVHQKRPMWCKNQLWGRRRMTHLSGHPAAGGRATLDQVRQCHKPHGMGLGHSDCRGQRCAMGPKAEAENQKLA